MTMAMPLRARAGGPADLSHFVSQPDGAHPYRVTWQADGGWYAAGKWTPSHPEQLAYGSTEERAIANLDRLFYVWSH